MLPTAMKGGYDTTTASRIRRRVMKSRATAACECAQGKRGEVYATSEDERESVGDGKHGHRNGPYITKATRRGDTGRREDEN